VFYDLLKFGLILTVFNLNVKRIFAFFGPFFDDVSGVGFRAFGNCFFPFGGKLLFLHRFPASALQMCPPRGQLPLPDAIVH
jgi:hypothetical protein